MIVCAWARGSATILQVELDLPRSDAYQGFRVVLDNGTSGPQVLVPIARVLYVIPLEGELDVDGALAMIGTFMAPGEPRERSTEIPTEAPS
jgi:hypothetical protein